jgi:steroid delta-isomerase
MKGMDGYPSHPAREMSIRSVTAVESGDCDGWLALFADDGVVQDPIGPSPLDPSGAGHRGKEAIAAFWDNVIAQGQIEFDVRESYAGGNECANVATITTTFPSGDKAIVDVVSTYRIDDAGQLAALRAFWEFDAMRFESA